MILKFKNNSIVKIITAQAIIAIVIAYILSLFGVIAGETFGIVSIAALLVQFAFIVVYSAIEDVKIKITKGI